MQSGFVSRRPTRTVLAAAALLTVGALGAEGFHRVWAAETGSGRDTVAAKALLMEKTNSLTEIENGFIAIADRIEPSVVSIEVQKKVSVGGGPNIERLFQDFQIPGQEDEDDNGNPGNKNGNRNPSRQRIFQFPFGGQGNAMPREFNQRGSGSGIVVGTNGWILTNDHVVDGADKVTVTLHDGRTFTGNVRRDPRSDLAVVKIDASDLTPVDFADSDKVRVGQWAIAFGSPFELNDTMTVGVISARQRQKMIADGGTPRFYPNLIQTDASINPGNSGGALVDSRGRVIGINVAINSPTGGNVGIAFAIPSNTAKDVMDQLIQSGKVVRGFLGVRPTALTPSTRKQYNVTDGALIEEVNEDTPASKAGFQVEDVVVKMNGKSIHDDIQFRDMVARTAPGTKIDVVVVRNGREQTLTATVGSVPTEGVNLTPKEKTQPTEEKKEGRLGVGVEPINAENSKQFNIEKGVTGVVVMRVEPDSPAAEEGLRPGDVIVRANGHDVRTVEDLKSGISALKSGETARLVVQRGKVKVLMTVAVR
jgi:serine protease Do